MTNYFREEEDELSWEDIQRLTAAFVVCVLGTAAHKGNHLTQTRLWPQRIGRFKAVPGNMVESDQNAPNFEFILIRLRRSSWRQPFFLKPRGSGLTAWSIKIR